MLSARRVAEHRRHQLHLMGSLKSNFKCNGSILGSRCGERKAVTVWESKLSVFRC